MEEEVRRILAGPLGKLAALAAGSGDPEVWQSIRAAAQAEIDEMTGLFLARTTVISEETLRAARGSVEDCLVLIDSPLWPEGADMWAVERFQGDWLGYGKETEDFDCGARILLARALRRKLTPEAHAIVYGVLRNRRYTQNEGETTPPNWGRCVEILATMARGNRDRGALLDELERFPEDSGLFAVAINSWSSLRQAYGGKLSKKIVERIISKLDAWPVEYRESWVGWSSGEWDFRYEMMGQGDGHEELVEQALYWGEKWGVGVDRFIKLVAGERDCSPQVLTRRLGLGLESSMVTGKIFLGLVEHNEHFCWQSIKEAADLRGMTECDLIRAMLAGMTSREKARILKCASRDMRGAVFAGLKAQELAL